MASSNDKLFTGFGRFARLQLSGRQHLIHHSWRMTATNIPIGTKRTEQAQLVWRGGEAKRERERE